jgi:hypothetical protein
MVHQYGIAGTQTAVAFTVDRDFLPADPDVGVAAGHVVVRRSIDALGAGRGYAIAVRDDNRVRSDGNLDAAEEEIVVPAASKQKERQRA